MSTPVMTVFRRHYPEYLIEAGGLGFLMIAAAILTVLLEHPASIAHPTTTLSLVRRFLIGLGMGLTIIVLVYPPWGKQHPAPEPY